MEKIHDCQNNVNEEIYMKAYNIIEKYFSDEEEQGPEDPNAAAQQGQGGTFGFSAQQQQNQQQPQQGGFSFANGADSMDM